jgi:sec-independent protein translocase protein TatB
MFDFGFSEILLVFVLALIVLGPERLPSVVRRVGRWVGRARAMARQFQEQLEEEIDLEGRHRPAAPDPASPEPAGAPAETHAQPGPASADERVGSAQAVEPALDSQLPAAASAPADAPPPAPRTHEPRA